MRTKNLAILFLVGCTLEVKQPLETASESGPSSGEPGTGAPTSGGPTGGATDDATTSTTTATGTAGVDDTGPAGTSGSSSSSSGGEPGSSSGGGEPGVCDPNLQNCPEGQKCNPWVPGGGDQLLSGTFKCVPLEPVLQPVNAPCSVLGDPVDGTDDCELGAVCLFPDDRGVGECHEICTTDDNQNFHCDTPGNVCTGPFCQDCTWAYCEVPCDPLDAATCDPGEVCVSHLENWVCTVDASGDLGAPGDPCEYVNVCDYGNACLDASSVPGCESTGCCAPMCDTEAPNTCPDAALGVACQPWWQAGDAPAGQETLGVCALPQ